MTCAKPKVNVGYVSQRDDVIKVVVEVSSLFYKPLASAGLCLIEKPDQEIIQRHTLKASNGNMLTYAAYYHLSG